MELFAHNGIDHATPSAAVAHSASSVLLTTLLITIVLALLVGSTVYLVNRFAFREVRIEKEEDN